MGRNWQTCGTNLFAYFKSIPNARSPWQVLIDILDDPNKTKALFEDNVSDIQKHIQSEQARWEILRRSRVKGFHRHDFIQE